MQKPVLISEILGLDLDMSNHDDNVEKRYAYIKEQLEKDPNWIGYEYLCYAYSRTSIIEMTHYLLSTTGEVYYPKSDGTYERVKQRTHRNDYQEVFLTPGFKCLQLHRALGTTFIPTNGKHVENGWNKLQVNHMDGVKQNNDIFNLEWTTISENIQHALAMGLQKSGVNHPDARVMLGEIWMHGPYKGIKFILAGNAAVAAAGMAMASIREQIDQNNPNRSLRAVHGVIWSNATKEDIEKYPHEVPEGYMDYYNDNRNIADPKSNVSIGEILKGPHTGFKFFLVGGKEIQSYGFGQDKVSRAASWGTKDPETRKKDGDVYRGIRWSYGTWDDVDELGLERGISKEMIETIK